MPRVRWRATRADARDAAARQRAASRSRRPTPRNARRHIRSARRPTSCAASAVAPLITATYAGLNTKLRATPNRVRLRHRAQCARGGNDRPLAETPPLADARSHRHRFSGSR